MAAYTQNLNLEKPEENENFRRQVLNDNMDKIDAAVNAKASKSSLDAHLADGTKHDKGFNLDLARCYMENVKPIALFQSDETWTTICGNAPTSDTANFKIGNQSQRKLEDSASGRAQQMVRNSVNLDLTKFADGSSSSTSDYIRFVFYVSDATKINTATGAGVQVAFSQNPSYSNVNVKFYEVKAGLVTGWNYVDIQLSSFSTLGTGAWGGIQSVSMRWDSVNNAQNAYVAFQYVALVRKDPYANYPNPFQYRENGNYVRDFAINSGFWFVGQEFGDIVARNLNSTESAAPRIKSLVGTKAYADCTICYRIIKSSTNAILAGIYVDNQNSIYAEISAGVLYISGYTEGVSFSSPSISFPVSIGDAVDIEIIRKGTSVSLIARLNGLVYTLSKEWISSVGYIGVGSYNTFYYTIKSLSITTIEHSSHANRADWAASVGKGTWEKIQEITLSTNTAQIDFTNISPEYKQLKIMLRAVRSSNTTTARDLLVRFNDVSTGSYGYGYITDDGGTLTTLNNIGTYANAITLKSLLGDSSTGFDGRGGELTIAMIANGNINILNGQYSFYKGGGASGYLYTYIVKGQGYQGRINKISLIPSADLIAAGSEFILMGVK